MRRRLYSCRNSQVSPFLQRPRSQCLQTRLNSKGELTKATTGASEILRTCCKMTIRGVCPDTGSREGSGLACKLYMKDDLDRVRNDIRVARSR
jgi:hypothetical protein